MFCLRGGPAHSEARRLRLLQTLRVAWPELRSLQTTFLYLVDANRALEAEERSILEALLAEGEAPSGDPALPVERVVVPRVGTR